MGEGRKKRFMSKCRQGSFCASRIFSNRCVVVWHRSLKPPKETKISCRAYIYEDRFVARALTRLLDLPPKQQHLPCVDQLSNGCSCVKRACAELVVQPMLRVLYLQTEDTIFMDLTI